MFFNEFTYVITITIVFSMFALTWRTAPTINMLYKACMFFASVLNAGVLFKDWPSEYVYAANMLACFLLASIWSKEKHNFFIKCAFYGLAFWSGLLFFS